MKVADLFSLNEDFKNCKLIAGEKGIDKEIKKVEIMEVPDGAFWAKEGSVIVTMGYSLKKKDITASSLVQMLIDKKVSALCIKLGRYIDEIPQNVLDYADEHNFAIINLPLNMTYENIVGPINEQLMDAERYELYLIKKLRADLCNIIHRNYNMNSIVSLIETYVEKNVAVVYADNYDVTGNINENEKEVLVDSLKSNIKYVYENEKDVLIDSNDKCFRVFKIETEHEIKAFLCVEETRDKPFSVTNYEVIYELIPTITIYLTLKVDSGFSISKKNEEIYFDILLGKYKDSKLKLAEEAAFLNIVVEKSRFCVVISLDDKKYIDEYIRLTSNILSQGENQFFVRVIEEDIVILLEMKKLITESKSIESYIYLLKNKLEAINKNRDISIGISNVCNSLYNLRYVYIEAKFALKISKKVKTKMNVQDKIFFYEDYLIYHLVNEISAYPIITRIYKNTIDRLKKNDQEFGNESFKTLNALVENDFSIGETSKSLYIHRNTLYKRIEKIKAILNFDIDKSENRLILQLALKIDEMI